MFIKYPKLSTCAADFYHSMCIQIKYNFQTQEQSNLEKKKMLFCDSSSLNSLKMGTNNYNAQTVRTPMFKTMCSKVGHTCVNKFTKSTISTLQCTSVLQHYNMEHEQLF